MLLSSLGWDRSFASSFEVHANAGFMPARVVLEHKHTYELFSAAGELSATCTGRMLHTAVSRAQLPAVGDWVAASQRPGELHADIHAVLPRKTKFSRRAAGESDFEQVVAANVDVVFLVTALDQNYSLRRIERYLAAAWESGAKPVVVLNKADLCMDSDAACAEVEAVALGAPVIALSALPHPAPSALAPDQPAMPVAGLEVLTPWLRPTTTVALLGSSGAGKSTLINRILGENRQATSAISTAVGKGRHTTSCRELIVAPSGVLVIDTPGMRELQLWNVTPAALSTTFAEIDELATRCRFRDCAHQGEPGCAIEAALESGELPPARWQSYQKLQREQAYAARKSDPRLAREERAVWKKLNKGLRDHLRMKEGD
jgi:ribosome biogenesis GTPase / thiamine phosphate phosphatase